MLANCPRRSRPSRRRPGPPRRRSRSGRGLARAGPAGWRKAAAGRPGRARSTVSDARADAGQLQQEVLLGAVNSCRPANFTPRIPTETPSARSGRTAQASSPGPARWASLGNRLASSARVASHSGRPVVADRVTGRDKSPTLILPAGAHRPGARRCRASSMIWSPKTPHRTPPSAPAAATASDTRSCGRSASSRAVPRACRTGPSEWRAPAAWRAERGARAWLSLKVRHGIPRLRAGDLVSWLPGAAAGSGPRGGTKLKVTR